MRLRLTLDHGETETPSDFASRLSTRACRDDLREFCRDFGLDAQGIIDGHPEAVGVLADLAGAEAEALLREAFVCTGAKRQYLHKGQDLLRSSLTRTRIRMCPTCMIEDIERLDCRMAARPHRRSLWLVRAIRTCTVHNMALVEIGVIDDPKFMHDTSRAVAAVLPRLSRLLDGTVRRVPSAFECYVAGRIGGTADPSWLDGLPLYAALQLSFVSGAVALHGPDVVLEDLSDDEVWRCEAAGFDVVDKGECGIRTLLDELQAPFRNSRSSHGPKAMYGRLHDWLAHETEDRAYDPVRDIIVEHAVETLPFGPGDKLFGREVDACRVHSIHTASKEFGLHPKRMRKLLRKADLTPEDTDRLADHRVTFGAEAAEEFLDALSESMSMESVRGYLNVPRPHDRGLLERGLITPMVRGGRRKGAHGIRRSDLDSLLARLLGKADPAHNGDPVFLPMIQAAKRSCCPVMDVVEMVLNGKLERVGMNPAERGFLSVLVDADEVRRNVVGPEHNGITMLRMKELEVHLRTSTSAVKALVEQGFIAVETVRNPVTKWVQPVVRPEELERIRREYVSLHNLSQERGEHFRRLKRGLDDADIRPVADPEELGLTLYRRSDLP